MNNKKKKALEWFDCKYNAKDNQEEAEIINTIRAALQPEPVDTDENKKALEALDNVEGKAIYSDAAIQEIAKWIEIKPHLQTFRTALQPKPSVDVEAHDPSYIRVDTPRTLTDKQFKAMKQIFELYKGLKGISEKELFQMAYTASIKAGAKVVSHLHSQGYLNQPPAVDGLVEALERYRDEEVCDTSIAEQALDNYHKPKSETVSISWDDFSDYEGAGGGSTITTYIKTDTPDVIKRALRAFQQEYCFEDSEYDKAIEEFLKEEK